MDLQGSLVNTNLLIYPTNNLLNYLKSLTIDDNVPKNIVKLVKGKDYTVAPKENLIEAKKISVYLNSKDIENLNKIKVTVKVEDDKINNTETDTLSDDANTKQDIENKDDSKDVKFSADEDTRQTSKDSISDVDKRIKGSKEDLNENTNKSKEDCNKKTKNKECDKEDDLYLTTSDIDWLYDHLQKSRRNSGKPVPYLYELLEGTEIRTPKNAIIKRNPELEARCVKLRAQQDAREYRKMTKSVDNVRMRFPEDSISYQLKQVNRQLIAIGQFIISIFAGFLFGFKGVEWLIGYLDFGFRLLLGVMCALIIALAEIYFLAKKLNEELNVPETIQLGGPPKFADQQSQYAPQVINKAIDKEHKD